MLPLNKAQVDLEEGTLRLEVGTTKNRDGRLVYLTLELKSGLAEQLARVRTLEQELNRGVPIVFRHLRGRFKGQRRTSHWYPWGRAYAKAGVSDKRLHDLRRSAV